MLTLWNILAAFNPADELDAHTRNSFGLDLTDKLLVFGVTIVVAGLLFFWAIYIRKRPNHKNGIPGLAPPNPSTSRHSRGPADQSEAGRRKVRIRKRKRQHPDNYPRNPTLGETGGLPPVRPEDPDPEPEAEETNEDRSHRPE